MRVSAAGLLAIALLALAGCGSTNQSSSSSTSSGATRTRAAATQAKTLPRASPVTGCQSQLTVGDHITLRVQLIAPKPAKYTLARVEGARDLTVNRISDETNVRGHFPTGSTGEYVLPGPHSVHQTKTVSATITATRPGNDAVYLRAWASNQATSAPPSNAPSTACPIVIRAR